MVGSQTPQMHPQSPIAKLNMSLRLQGAPDSGWSREQGDGCDRSAKPGEEQMKRAETVGSGSTPLNNEVPVCRQDTRFDTSTVKMVKKIS